MPKQLRSLSGWLRPYVYLSSNSLSLVGVIFVTAASVLWVYLLPVFLNGMAGDPYTGILIFMGLPSLFLLGLIIIPLGIIVRGRRERRKGIYPASFPPLDFKNRDWRRLLLFIGVTTAVNVVIGGQLVYSGVNYMDSVTFCGETCHTVMKPEYVAYLHSPHARVACVKCHIGPGASWFVRSKLSGTYQVFATIFNTFPRPIPVPITNLRPARATCEQCHWPARFEGNRLTIIPHYASDETNTLTEDVLLMHIGGGDGQGGIHGAHVSPGVTIRYGSDPSRQKMDWVYYTDTRTGKKTLFVAPGVDPKSVDTRKGRIMDCIDCHNEPSHTFHLPGKAMDKAMANGQISPSLPFVKKEGVALLEENYSSQADAARRIPEELSAYYQSSNPSVMSQQKAAVEQAGKSLVAIFDQNVFPKMNVKWGTYPNSLSHEGCFRCHGALHNSSVTYMKIPKHCDMCHTILAQDSKNPKILDELQLSDPGGSSTK